MRRCRQEYEDNPGHGFSSPDGLGFMTPGVFQRLGPQTGRRFVKYSQRRFGAFDAGTDTGSIQKPPLLPDTAIELYSGGANGGFIFIMQIALRF